MGLKPGEGAKEVIKSNARKTKKKEKRKKELKEKYEKKP